MKHIRNSQTKNLDTALISEIINTNLIHSKDSLPVEQCASLGLFVSLIKIKLGLSAMQKLDVHFICYKLNESGIELIQAENSARYLAHYQFKNDVDLVEAERMYEEYWRATEMRRQGKRSC